MALGIIDGEETQRGFREIPETKEKATTPGYDLPKAACTGLLSSSS